MGKKGYFEEKPKAIIVGMINRKIAINYSYSL